MRAWSVPLLLLLQVAQADEATVAVAANFQPALETLVERFEQVTAHRVKIASGSTGKLYAQIVNGAPFDVLLAADQARPSLLGEQGLGVRESRFTYVTGRLALVAARGGRLRDDAATTLARDDLRAIAIANPALAPYGEAAREVLVSLGLSGALNDRIVMGENVGQAYALVATGNADVGLVALSLAMAAGDDRFLPIPDGLHAPIRQDAILLVHGRDNPAATAFMAFLRDDHDARQLIAAAGFGVD